MVGSTGYATDKIDFCRQLQPLSGKELPLDAPVGTLDLDESVALEETKDDENL